MRLQDIFNSNFLSNLQSISLLDMALAMYGEMCSFDDYQIDAYEHLT